jgi:hypothetical protein
VNQHAGAALERGVAPESAEGAEVLGRILSMRRASVGESELVQVGAVPAGKRVVDGGG